MKHRYACTCQYNVKFKIELFIYITQQTRILNNIIVLKSSISKIQNWEYANLGFKGMLTNLIMQNSMFVSISL